MLEVQKYLQNHSISDLKEEFGIRAVEYQDRVVLNYSQIDSYKHRFNPIVIECRSLILGLDNEILSRSFDRFFNYGEDPFSDNFRVEKSKAHEKIDGSIMTVYYDGSKWQVASRQMAYAEGPVPNKSRSYRDVFVEALGAELDETFKDVDKHFCIIFEMVSPETRVVTPYPKPMLYLLDVRNKNTGEFLGNEESYGWEIPLNATWRYPQTFEFLDMERCLRASNELPAMEEGYVLVSDDISHGCISNKWRIKVKNPAYLAIAHLRENGAITEKRIIKLVFMRDHEEYLLNFPEDRKYFDPYIEAYDKMVEDVSDKWLKYFPIGDQKEFALAIKDCPAKGVLFGMRKGIPAQEMLDGFQDNYKVRLLDGYRRKQ